MPPTTAPVNKRRLDVHIYVTPQCNLTCSHCYYDAFDKTRQPERLLSLKDISSVLTDLCARFEPDIHLEGGEPFLRNGIEGVLAGLDDQVLRALTVTTNGTIKIGLAPKTLRALGMLRISIDGHTDELQRELRGIDLRPVLRTCGQLRELEVPFVIRMTLWKRNIRALAAIYEFVEDNEFEQLSLYEFQSSGRGIGQDLQYGVSAADIVAFLDALINLPRPSCLRLLTVNLAERRVDAVHQLRTALETAGVTIRDLALVPNCTINYDGTVGVSPWRVTAHGAPDVFTTTEAPDFLNVIEAAAGRQALDDDSGCLSRIQLRLAL